MVMVALGAAVLAWANWPLEPLAAGRRADRVMIEKRQRRLTLYAGAQVLRSYPVSLGRVPVGPKRVEGDKKTPEGCYRVSFHKADSAFHLALRLSYPNADDRARAAALGLPPGDFIMIHGLPNGWGWLGRLQRLRDWTVGCIALTDAEIEQIYAATPDGAVVEIRE